MKFAYYGACETAKTDNTYGNLLTYTTNTLGAATAIGFEESVSNNTATYFETELFDHLADGVTVSYSALLACLGTYAEFGYYGNVDSYIVSGSGATTTIN
jgi:hypothetical protein